MALLCVSVSIIQAGGMPALGVIDQVKYLGWDSSCAANLLENYFKNDKPLTCPTSIVGTFLLLCMKHPGRHFLDRSGQMINENLFRLMRLRHQLIYSYRQFNTIL